MCQIFTAVGEIFCRDRQKHYTSCYFYIENNRRKIFILHIFTGGVNYTQELPPGSFINAAEFSNPDNLAFYLYYLLQVYLSIYISSFLSFSLPSLIDTQLCAYVKSMKANPLVEENEKLNRILNNNNNENSSITYKKNQFLYYRMKKNIINILNGESITKYTHFLVFQVKLYFCGWSFLK